MTGTGPGETARGLRVLVVEDEALIALEIEDILAELGHEVVAVAESVERAVAAIGRLSATLDVAMVDADLRGESAAPVARALVSAGVPFLVTSAYEGDQLARIGFPEAVRVPKPYDARAIAGALARMVPPRAG